MVEMLGAVIPCYLLLRLFQWMMKKVPVTWVVRLVIATIAAYGGSVVLGAWGYADGGPLRFDITVYFYVIPAIVAGLIEAVRQYRAIVKESNASQL